MHLSFPALAGLALAGLVAFARPALAAPSFDCALATGWVEQTICATPILARQDAALDQRNLALEQAVRAAPLRAAIEGDRRAWLAERDACAAEDDRTACLRQSYLTRRRQLDFHWLTLLGPDLAAAPSTSCSLAATNQVEIRACRRERAGYVARTLKLAASAAGPELAALDRITSADLGAEAAFTAAQAAYEAYRDAECEAVAASFGGGSGTGIAALTCTLEMDWRRANVIAERYLFRVPHWTDRLATLVPHLDACLSEIGMADEPRVTGVTELADGSLRLRVAIDRGRLECALSAEAALERVTPIAADDVWPSERPALFYPDGARVSVARTLQPSLERCRQFRWFPGRDGKAAGWIALQLCW